MCVPMCLEKIKSRPTVSDPPFDFEMVLRYSGNLVERSRDRERLREQKWKMEKKEREKKTSNATTRNGQKKRKKRVAHNEALYSS